ncbi:MAG: four helix bundle protein [Hyphomicrobium sp.]|uniref:four helix bundle protein n=1 Tax=Hyphomicrobium sp. TaxID=82 RepID=UPI001320CEC7|nr:four helix bundle protein [Hyphomicrobium sp.]KAB2941056.1 MAG: four helix bundle protein [Hyphomicrobium sp.]MBZ0210945.1 four helix bundle protein [Hyphomicrobium sp.]
MLERKASISSYRDLVVWQEAMNLAEMAYRLTAGFPKDESYGLTSQIRRAGTSIPANIAEGYGRDSKGAYLQHLRVAQGSLKEFETHALLAERVELVDKAAVDALLTKCEMIGKMLRSLIRSIENSG